VTYVEKPSTSAYKGEVTTASPNQESKAAENVDTEASRAMGDWDHGKKVGKKCTACHPIKEGGKNKIGPALDSGLGRKVAALSEYKYTKACVAKGKAGTSEEMNGF
jgi:Cytochrome c2